MSDGAPWETVALTWSPSAVHGWGVFGASLLRELLRRGRPRPLLLAPLATDFLDADERRLFATLAEDQARLAHDTASAPGMLQLKRVCVLHGLASDLTPTAISARFRGAPNVGFAFFESADSARGAAARLGWLDAVLAGSRWNAEALASHGVPRVACVLQGVDTERFRPAPPTGRFGDRFVVFSGGKLELRKGQDLVVAAFRRFHARRPDALLVTVWMNPFPALLATIAASPHVGGAPSPTLPPSEAIQGWVRAQGVPEGAHVDLGCVPNAELPRVLRECHAAVLPSRCEGGTNLVAMECMAMELPCILSANTGHLDVLADDRAIPLRSQRPVAFGPPGSDVWRESDVEEIVEALEAVYVDRDAARRRGRAARAFVEGLTWSAQTTRLLDAIARLTSAGPPSSTDAVAIDRTIAAAVALHRQGRLADADASYAAVLAVAPDHFDALHLRGVVRHQQGRDEEALAWIGAALERNPASPEARSNLGLALQALGRDAEALAQLERALALRPEYPEALTARGISLLRVGRAADAVSSYDRALALDPTRAEAWNNRGNALRALGRHADAVASYERALDVRPDYADALANRGVALSELSRHAEAVASFERVLALQPARREVWNERGIALDALERHDEALASYDRALALDPAFAPALTNRGNALHALGSHEEALASYAQAIAIDPRSPEIVTNQGVVLHAMNRHEDAIARYDAALALQPDYADAHCNRGSALHRLARHDEALESYEAAIAAQPDHAEAHWFRGLLHLSRGDFETGWREAEWRWSARSFTSPRREFSAPRWSGDEPVAGKTLLIHAEQGFGDTIQFLRFVPLVAERGARIVLEVQAPLVSLVAASGLGVVQLVAAGAPVPAVDLHCPLMSLPFALGTTLASLPAPAPYLYTDAARGIPWGERLERPEGPDAGSGDAAGLRVGIAWSGRAEHRNDANRSIALARLAPLLDVAGTRFVSLQTELRADDARTLARFPRLLHAGDALADFADTAALASRLDLVISVDTAAAHLAGALARPLFVLLPFSPDWRWMLERDDSPWYPTARLFRQPRAGDWESVVARVREALTARASG